MSDYKFTRYTTSGKFTRGHRRAAKLTPEQVLEIRRLYSEEGWTQSRLSLTFGMSVGQIGRIVRGEQWQGYTQIPNEQEIGDRMVREPASAEEIAESEARMKVILETPPPPASSTGNAADLASLLDGLRKRKAELQQQVDKGDSNEDSKDDRDVGKA
jgi:DNA-binding transcriptional regulator LsrR (DeoR family)